MKLSGTPVSQWLQRAFLLIQSLVPPHLRDDIVERTRAENLVVALLLTVLFTPAYALVYLREGDPISAAVCISGCLGALGAAALLRVCERPELPREVLTVVLWTMQMVLI